MLRMCVFMCEREERVCSVCLGNAFFSCQTNNCIVYDEVSCLIVSPSYITKFRKINSLYAFLTKDQEIKIKSKRKN